MQVTKISAYSLQQLLKQNVAGTRVVGYTVRPGYSNGLFLTSRRPVGAVV